MRGWALIHPASGAIVMVTTMAEVEPPAHLAQIEAPHGIDPARHWWTGDAFAERIEGEIAVSCTWAEVGTAVTVTYPADAWISGPDGAISDSRSVVIGAGRSRQRVSLVGQYRGEAVIDIVPASAEAAMAQVRAERDRRLLASDRYALDDFPIGASLRSAWSDYREALREIPALQPEANMATVMWPQEPA